MKKFLSAWLPGLLALAAALAMLLPHPRARGFDVERFGGLPVLQGGRVKPLDSVARNTLLEIRSKQSVRFEGRTVEAGEWLLDVMFRPQVADAQPIFVINDPDVLGLLGIQQTSDRYYAFKVLLPQLAVIEAQAQAAQAVDPKVQNRFQKAVLNLYGRLLAYHRLKNTVAFSDVPLAAELLNLGAPVPDGRYQELGGLALFRILPPQGPGEWQTVGGALGNVRATGLHPLLMPLAKAGAAYAAGNAAAFNEQTAELRAKATALVPEGQRQADHELLFNRAQPFYAGIVIFVLALLVVLFSWIWQPGLLQPAAFSLLAAGALVQTGGLVSRIVLQGRPPVTNLYSSAVFVGWVAVILGLVMERLYRKGFGTAVAAVAGFSSLIVAHHLAAGEDTMEMMRAVLDSNFWLGTHVVTITIGYGATFLAGIIAIFQIIRRQLPGGQDPEVTQTLLSMIYGIVCFALLFSFVGTILGGIWADQSWGRFWGWDPKENGALLIVLWNAVILHARWGGFIKERGLLACALFGNIITSLSWFGVNMLGVGLHSYGFMDSAVVALASFIGSQLLLIFLCFVPPLFWRRPEA
jgi:ABC-type transport system involved in cytochrome c biogenesis permease subunit